MNKEFFHNKAILGTCEGSLYFLWVLVDMIECFFDGSMALYSDPELRSAWIDFKNAVDSVFSRTLNHAGVVSEVAALFLSDDPQSLTDFEISEPDGG